MNTIIFCKRYVLYKNAFIYLFMCLFFFSNPVLNAATLKTSIDFESGVLKDIACAGNCPKDSTALKTNGSHSAQFTLTPKMSTRYRTEAVLRQHGHFERGKEYWVSFDYFYNNWGKDRAGEVAPFQIHGRASSWDAACGKFRYAPFHMESSNDQVAFMTYGVKEMWKGPIEKNQWLNIAVHFKLSAGRDGFIEAWKNGVKLGRVDGQNDQAIDSCGKPNRSSYLKIGIYKFPWRKNPVSDVTHRELFIDNLKIVEGSNGYSLVNPTKTVSTPKNNFRPTPVKPILKDTLPPKINNVQVSVTGTNAMISWNSNEASSSLVKYGLTSSYKSHTDNDLFVTSHKVTLKNLMAGKTYHYQVSSEDNSGNTGKGLNLTFTTDSPMEESLVAHWLMEDGKGTNVVDVSGNGHTGKLINGAKLIKGEGINFDGINDYLDVGKLNVSGKAITISAWFLADDLSNCRYQDCRILSKATSTREQDHYFMVSTVRAGSKTRLRFRLKTNGVTSTVVATSGDILENEWVHVSAIYDGETMRLYKDGIEVGSAAKRGNITINNKSSVWIGGNPSHGKSRPWKGQIDDVRIYSYSLTDDEIELLSLGQ